MSYCTAANVIDRLSLAGVADRTDDVPPTTLGDVLQMAADEIQWYCLEQYSDTALASSTAITGMAADIAAFYLCERRGNPPPAGIAQKYDRAIAKLEGVQKGRTRIPGLQRRKSYAPVISNVRTVLRPYPRSVVERNRSTGTPTNYNQSNRDPFDALNNYMDFVI